MSTPFWKSKTLWTNVIVIVLAPVSGEYGPFPLDGQTITILVAALNMVLRLITSTSISTR